MDKWALLHEAIEQVSQSAKIFKRQYDRMKSVGYEPKESCLIRYTASTQLFHIGWRSRRLLFIQGAWFLIKDFQIQRPRVSENEEEILYSEQAHYTYISNLAC